VVVPDELLMSVAAEIEADEACVLKCEEQSTEPGMDNQITPDVIAKAKIHIRALIERERTERRAHRPSKWPKRISKPRAPAKTDAERQKARRDRNRDEFNAAALKVDRTAIAVEADERCALLRSRLADGPLSAKLRLLRLLRGREKELSIAWMAREIVRGEPLRICRQGPPTPMARIIEIFAAHYPISATADPGAAMRRKLKLVQAIEEAGIWPPASSIGAGSSVP